MRSKINPPSPETKLKALEMHKKVANTEICRELNISLGQLSAILYGKQELQQSEEMVDPSLCPITLIKCY